MSALDPALAALIFNALTVWPFWRILRRAGLRPHYALLALVPLVGQTVVIGLLAHSRWPNRVPPPPKPRPRPRREA